MQEYFSTLADAITASLHGDEFYTCTFRAEDSDFVRFNRSAIRQAGTVVQRFLTLDLIHGRRHAAAGLAPSTTVSYRRVRRRSMRWRPTGPPTLRRRSRSRWPQAISRATTSYSGS